MSISVCRKSSIFETAIRSYLKKYIQRKVDIFVTEDLSEGQMSLKYNEALASEYLDYFRQMEEKFGLENDVHLPLFPDTRKSSQWKSRMWMKRKCGMA